MADTRLNRRADEWLIKGKTDLLGMAGEKFKGLLGNG